MTALCNDYFCILDPFTTALLFSAFAVICAYWIAWWVSEGIDDWRSRRANKLDSGARK